MVDVVEREELLPGFEFEYEPLEGGGWRMSAYFEGELIESGEYADSVLDKPNYRAQLLSNVKSGLEGVSGIEADAAAEELRKLLVQLSDMKAQEPGFALSETAQNIIDGTERVEVHKAEETIWYVTLTLWDETHRLEFTTEELLSDGGALVGKIANYWTEFISVGEKEFRRIREEWKGQKEIVETHEDTGTTAVFDAIISFLDSQKQVVAEKEKLDRAPTAVWFDANNQTFLEDAPQDAAIVWVRDAFLRDALDHIGKSQETKPKLIRDMSATGPLYRGNLPKSWGEGWNSRKKMYPFEAEAFAISDAELSENEAAHEEVEA